MPRTRTKDNKRRKTLKDMTNYHRLLGVVCLLVLFGLIMILSASSIRAFANTGDSYYFIKKQIASLAIGTLTLLFFSRTRISSLQKAAPQAIYVIIALLVAVLIPGIGKNVDGSSRWIPIGFFHLQPSEFAKVAVILYTADFLSKNKAMRIRDIKDLIYPYGFVVAAIVGLVMLQPDLGTTLTICMGAFTLLFIGGLNLRYMLGIGLTGAVVGAYSIYSREYQLKRFMAFLNPNIDPLGAGYHIKQSLMAFGSGGLFGVGLGLSRQKYFYLPAAHTDFIFAIIGEELGLLGTLFTVSLFVAFAFYGFRVSFQCRDDFCRLLGAGITSMIVLQALVNMGAVTGILPITGIPMPFISYGGSSLMVNLAAIGMLLSIARRSERETSSRSTKPELYVVENHTIDERKADHTKRSSTSKKRKEASASSKASKSRSSSSPATASASSSKSKTTKKTGGTKSDAGNNKRRRDGGSRVSRSSSRQSTSKSKKRY